ncbi:MAG: NAD(P)/FAD-dependent oxidoreductase [Chloroflexota bacterium]
MKSLRAAAPQPIAYVVDRRALDQALARHAQEKGAELRVGMGVKGLEVDGHGATVRVEGNGHHPLCAQAVVLATGFPSPLPALAGLGEVSRWGIGAQAEVPVNGLEETEVYLGQGIAPGFFAWLVPTAPGHALAGLISSRPGPYLQSFLKDLHRQGKVKSAQAPLCFRRIAFSPLPRTYGDRVVAVGEAAGQVKATTGGGIFYGLLCAEEAAMALHRALSRGDLSARSLSSYERAWQSRLGPEMRMGGWARGLYARLSDRRIDEVFSLVQSSGLADAVGTMQDLSFDWHSPVIRHALKQQALRGLKWLLPVPLRLSRSPSPPRSLSPLGRERGKKDYLGDTPRPPSEGVKPPLNSPKDEFRDELL